MHSSKIVWLVLLAPGSSNLIFLGYFFGQLRSSVQERHLDFFVILESASKSLSFCMSLLFKQTNMSLKFFSYFLLYIPRRYKVN